MGYQHRVLLCLRPLMTPMPSGASTPLPHQNGSANGTLGDYLSAPLGKGGYMKAKTYLAGSKALDSLSKLIASTEGFFHPTNSGSWTNDVRHVYPFWGDLQDPISDSNVSFR